MSSSTHSPGPPATRDEVAEERRGFETQPPLAPELRAGVLAIYYDAKLVFRGAPADAEVRYREITCAAAHPGGGEYQAFLASCGEKCGVELGAGLYFLRDEKTLEILQQTPVWLPWETWRDFDDRR